VFTESDAVENLFDRIAVCKQHAVPLNATGFRFAGTRYANEADLLSGQGAAGYGGRWNPRGLIAIYASLDPLTAVMESDQNFLDSGFSAPTLRPRVLAGLTIRLQSVLKVTDRRVRRFLGFTVKDLIMEDWPAIQQAGQEAWTQAIGRGAALAGFEGILVPSARRRYGKNVVVFPTNLGGGSKVEAIGKEDLPPHPSQWPG